MQLGWIAQASYLNSAAYLAGISCWDFVPFEQTVMIMSSENYPKYLLRFSSFFRSHGAPTTAYQPDNIKDSREHVFVVFMRKAVQNISRATVYQNAVTKSGRRPQNNVAQDMEYQIISTGS